MKRMALPLLATALLALSSCRPEPHTLTLATTTSVDNSGLLAYLAPIVKRELGVDLRWIAVGTGKAIRLGAEGRVVATITHDADAEAAANAARPPRLYRQFMRNEFVIVGPPSNPARLGPGDDPVTAFRKIAQSGSRFCSRADQSGTHARELKIWKLAGIAPGGPNYFPLGQSMSALLRSADELGAYTLTDRATFEQLEKSVTLRDFVSDGALLQNVYAITLMRTDRQDTEARDAARFAAWLLSPRGTAVISAFQIRGQQQFFPIAPPARPAATVR